MRIVLVIATAIVMARAPSSNTDSRTYHHRPMEGATEPIAAPPSELPEFRGPPPPRHGGLLTLMRFLRRHGMLNRKYAHLVARLGLWKLRLGKRLLLDGLAFVGPGCSLEVRKGATL